MTTSSKFPAGWEVVEGDARERRRDSRESARDHAFVQIVDASEAELIGFTFPCDVIEVSSSGVRIRTEHEIPDGARLDLWIDIGLPQGKIFVTSEARWVSWEDNGDFHAGLEILDGPATDADLWREINEREIGVSIS
ncbi:MAG: PilZ domain-containing protein [Pseudomonadales bacterium]|nr:PilZ domain-containing protein [Pseudomonadales bacterium]